MKKVGIYSVLLQLATFLSSCGIGAALNINHNQNATEVNLSENNFKVIDKVSGSSGVTYVLAMEVWTEGNVRKCVFKDVEKSQLVQWF